jgi:hypothetical protein
MIDKLMSFVAAIVHTVVLEIRLRLLWTFKHSLDFSFIPRLKQYNRHCLFGTMLILSVPLGDTGSRRLKVKFCQGEK